MPFASIAQIAWLGGSLFGLAAILTFWWALFADRSRGRHRCPRCWYEMTAVPSLVCSECGRTVKNERRLRRTRRHRGRAVIATILSVLAMSCALAPAVQRGGWQAIVPTTVLIGLPRRLTDSQGALAGELIARYDAGEMANWQVSWYWRRQFDVNAPPWSIDVLTRQTWPSDCDVRPVVMVRWKPNPRSWSSRGVRFRLRVAPETRDGEVVYIYDNPGGRTHVPPIDAEAGREMGIGDLPRWRERSRSLGRCAPGAHELALRIGVQVKYPPHARGRSRWVDIVDDSATARITVGGPIGTVMTPIESDAIAAIIRTRLWVALFERSLRIVRAFPALPELGEAGALGLVFEVRCDGVPVARTSGWWGNHSAQRSSEALFWEWGTFDIEAMILDPAANWVMHVTGDPRLALRAFDDMPPNAPDPDTYWTGAVEIPLVVSETQRCAVPEGIPLAPADRGWDLNVGTGRTPAAP